MLRRLRRSGVYRGKVDLRKAPSSYQKALATKLVGYRRTRKGLRKVERTPRVRKVSTVRAVPSPERYRIPEHVRSLLVPFGRKGGVIEWRRFTPEMWQAFKREYLKDRSAKSWEGNIIEEDIEADDDETEGVGAILSGESVSMGDVVAARARQSDREARELAKDLGIDPASII